MNVLLRLNEGIVDLQRFDAVRVAERGGHRILIGERADTLTEHVLAFFDRQHPTEEDKPTKLLDDLAASAEDGREIIDARDLTIRPTEQIQADIALAPPTSGPEEEVVMSETLPRAVFLLRRADSTPKELQMLKGRRVTGIELSGELVGLICDEE